MASIILPAVLTTADKIRLMAEDARFEIASDYDAESCSAERAVNASDRIRSKPAPPKIPKAFVACGCVFNCAYCGCRNSLIGERCSYCNDPRDLAHMATDMAKENGHGVFVTSAIYKNADYTQELIAETVRVMREEEHYHGFIHAKVMPGADPLLIHKTGVNADRLSVNIEVAKSEGYARIAKQKNRQNILTPMGNISEQIAAAKHDKEHFAYSQTTQLMAGSTGEDDRTIMTLSKALYSKYRLKRVYYTAFRYNHDAEGYDKMPFVITPYWRMARLYQADRLMQLYGFTPEDVTPEAAPFLEQDIDPKAAWALRHLDLYPVEINTADYETLIRVPGIGVTYAKKIIAARRYSKITNDILKQMRIALKRCKYFITCDGKYVAENLLDSPALRDCLLTGSEDMSITESLAESRVCETC
ncbi:MAG: helix-hairpin-helix domain-containing protein [Eubacteriales bacterium]